MRNILLISLLVLFIKSSAQSPVKFIVPEIEVPASEYIDLPIVIETNNNTVGSLEFALNYDPTYLEFSEVIVTTDAQQWLTYTMDWNDEKVRWGGYDATFGSYNFVNPTELFTIRFKVIDQNWAEIPITIGRKTAGTELGWDISVDNTDGYINKKSLPFEVQATDGIYGIVYPVPTKGVLNLELTVPNNGDYDINVLTYGGKNYGTIRKRFFSGYVSFQMNLNYLAQGIYLLQITNGNFTKTFKILKQ